MAKKKILLLSDDLRMNSGIATMSRELVLSTVHQYDWVQLAGAITHPEKGKIFDLSQATNEQKKIKDASVKLYPTDGYGNEQELFQVISVERPNAILHFTDPRFWGWLYSLEKQIRSTMPLTYLNIWDDIPCQMNERTLLQYCPHGIDPDIFYPVLNNDPRIVEFRKRMFNEQDYNFVIMYNSRNVQRKRTSNIVLAYRTFCDNLSKEEAAKCVLILHTEIMQEAGTNLLAIKEALCPDYNILFSPGKLSPPDMSLMYNIADVTINVSSNEGFGLSIAESIMCGTPVIAAVTGGLQDQIGQITDEGTPVEFDADFGSNNVGKYKKHGPWAYPVWPVTRLIQGSIPTPYIFDDLTKWEDAAEGFMYWYLAGNKKREIWGEIGRKWALEVGGINSKNMGQQFINGMEYVFSNWSKPKKFGVYSVKDYIGNTMTGGHMGFEIPKIDKNVILKKLETLPV